MGTRSQPSRPILSKELGRQRLAMAALSAQTAGTSARVAAFLLGRLIDATQRRYATAGARFHRWTSDRGVDWADLTE